FFQAEDGIRDFHVTGVQTCALPILLRTRLPVLHFIGRDVARFDGFPIVGFRRRSVRRDGAGRLSYDSGCAGRRRFRRYSDLTARSEERRVGKYRSCAWL